MATPPAAPHPAESEVARLKQRIAQLEAMWALNNVTDELIEEAHKAKLSLAETLETLWPAVLPHFGAQGLFLFTYDESLAMSPFVFFDGLGETRQSAAALPEPPDVVSARVEDGSPYFRRAGGLDVFAQRLDVAGDFFGAVGVVFAAPQVEPTHAHHYAMLDVFAEELDNFLSAIRLSRLKQQLLVRVSGALKHRVLDRGINEAVAIVAEAIDFSTLIIYYHEEDDQGARGLHYKVFEGATPVVNSRTARNAEVEALFHTSPEPAQARPPTETLVRRALGGAKYREEVLINGVIEERPVGKILVASEHDEFNTFNRDLLERFADTVRQRVVDFNKERKHLLQFFSHDATERLLAQRDYERELLSTRGAELVMLYIDLCGFTKISEQLLDSPEDVGALINAWSEAGANIIWDAGGVVDKLVGDCLIGLFGPPFFDDTPAERVATAIDCALAIQDATRALGEREAFRPIAESSIVQGLACSAGVNLGAVTVGFFGPSRDFTCFGSPMNNAARLQAAAGFGQTFVMAPARDLVTSLGRFTFGPEGAVQAKNVREPLLYAPVSRA